ncbi:MAG: hypothetical protein FJZ08_01915 [Candidatus Omnitrophica bacterium]|nr:hypothetical protein [Candidatus Omnitrophota bacterium]
MPKEERLNWDFYSLALISLYAILQLLRWPILPQFMDIYYHILTAWGFIQSGGYVGWDFWQYAPVGRVHIYPPFFHILFALLMKCGVSVIILAKFFETFTPLLFLFTLWVFLKKNYHARLAFFAVLLFGSSFSFYASLINHIPATLAAIFGLLAIDQFLRRRIVSSTVLLSLSFYTHIGLPWVFALAIFFYGLMDKEKRGDSLWLLFYSLILSAPVFFKELNGLKYIKTLGFSLQENNNIRLKIAEYILATLGLFLVYKKRREYRLFFSFLLGSLLLLFYPYRFFSGEGYLAIILLGSIALSELFNLLTDRLKWPVYAVLSMLIIFELFSPALVKDKTNEVSRAGYRLCIFDSLSSKILFTKWDSMWFAKEYAQATEIIKKNSDSADIIYSTLNPAGMGLAAISGRATANALFVEIGPAREFDPFAVSKIIVFPADEEKGALEELVRKYNLEKISQTQAFILYKNPGPSLKVKVERACVPLVFIVIFILAAGIILVKNRRKIYLT